MGQKPDFYPKDMEGMAGSEDEYIDDFEDPDPQGSGQDHGQYVFL